MSENLRSPNIYHPKTILDLLLIKRKNHKAVLWAGGTYLMSRPDYYPNPEQQDIVRLDGISDLFKIVHSDKYIEVGCMVTLEHLITNGSAVISKEVAAAVSNIANSNLRSTITVGGALATQDFRSSFSCILATIGAMVELRFFNMKNYSRWISVSKLYDSLGNNLYAEKAFIAKIRIPSSESQLAQFFATLDSPLHNEDSSVSIGLQYTVNQGSIAQSSVCVSYPVSGFLVSGELESRINSINLPAKPSAIQETARQIRTYIHKTCPLATELQLERTERLFEQVLFNINIKYMAD